MSSDPVLALEGFGVAFGEQPVDLTAATVTVAPVPLPAAAWLMAGALAGLAVRGRRAATVHAA